MGRQSNSGAGSLIHNLIFPHSRNGITTHDETEVEVKGMSQLVEIPS